MGTVYRSMVWYCRVWYGEEYGEDRPTQAGTGQWTGAGGACRQCERSTREREGSVSNTIQIQITNTIQTRERGSVFNVIHHPQITPKCFNISMHPSYYVHCSTAQFY